MLDAGSETERHRAIGIQLSYYTQEIHVPNQIVAIYPDYFSQTRHHLTFLVDIEGEEHLREAARVPGNLQQVWLQASQVEHKLCQSAQSQVVSELV